MLTRHILIYFVNPVLYICDSSEDIFWIGVLLLKKVFKKTECKVYLQHLFLQTFISDIVKQVFNLTDSFKILRPSSLSSYTSSFLPAFYFSLWALFLCKTITETIWFGSIITKNESLLVFILLDYEVFWSLPFENTCLPMWVCVNFHI